MVFICVHSATFAQGVENEAEISRLLASQILANEPLSTSRIIVSEVARETLVAAGMVGDRFKLDHTIVFESKIDGDEQVLTLGAIYQEETTRRLWLVIRAWYKVSATTIQVSRAEVFWNSPDVPEVQLRMVPRGAVSLSGQPVTSYAQSVVLINEILAQAINPADAAAILGDAALIFIDRIAFDAEVSLTISETAEGEAIRSLESTRLEATGWPILIVQGEQLGDGFLQVRYRAGSDRNPTSTARDVIAAYAIGNDQ